MCGLCPLKYIKINVCDVYHVKKYKNKFSKPLMKQTILMKQAILFLHSQNLKKNLKLYYILRCPAIREVLWDTLCGIMTNLLIR